MKLNIITLNCFDSPLLLKRKARIDRLISELVSYRADIYCFQELIFLKRAKRISKIFEKLGYYSFFTPGKRLNKGGLLFVSKYPIQKSEYIKFKNQATPFSFQLTDRFLKKGYQKNELVIEGKKITVINTHLVSLYKTISAKEKRVLLNQYKELLDDLNKIKNKTIVAGDFNISFTEKMYQELEEKTNLFDPFRNENIITVSKDNTQRKHFYKIKKDTRLDYVLLSNDSKMLNFKVILKDLYRLNRKNINLSDHYGLMVEVEI